MIFKTTLFAKLICLQFQLYMYSIFAAFNGICLKVSNLVYLHVDSHIQYSIYFLVL